MFELRDAGGASWRMITPDVLRNAVVDADRRIQDFRVIQTGTSAIDLVLDAKLAPDAAATAGGRSKEEPWKRLVRPKSKSR